MKEVLGILMLKGFTGMVNPYNLRNHALMKALLDYRQAKKEITGK